MPPTIVLVHRALADASSWNGVTGPALSAEHALIAALNPLRSLAAAAAVAV